MSHYVLRLELMDFGGIVFVEIHSSFWVICVSKKCSCSGFPALPMRDYFEELQL